VELEVLTEEESITTVPGPPAGSALLRADVLPGKEGPAGRIRLKRRGFFIFFLFFTY